MGNHLDKLLTQSLQALADFLKATQQPPVVALSGGRDSQLLLHMLCCLRQEGRVRSLSACHIDHGIHPESASWAKSCERLCQQLKVPYHSVRLDLDANDGNLEARAREARYQALSVHLAPDQWLLTAHHQQDQAETLLLRLLHGTGVRGAAGMQKLTPFAQGWLARPLLDLSPQTICQLADYFDIEPIVDPSNRDLRFRRNFLRHQVLPELARLWPDASGQLAAFCELAGESRELLNEVALRDLKVCFFNEADLSLDKAALLALEGRHQKNLLNYLGHLTGSYPSQAAIVRALSALRQSDSVALEQAFGKGVLRQYQGRVYCTTKLAENKPPLRSWPDIKQPVSIEKIGHLFATIETVGSESGRGLRLPKRDEAVTIRFRRGGERCRPMGREKSNKLKILFQELQVPPWRRAVWPLVYYGDELVAAAGLFESADHQAEAGGPTVRFHWQEAIMPDGNSADC